MKTSLAVAVALLPFSALVAQGPLAPPVGANPAVGPANALTPGGAPQATMKTLHQVEPRIPIDGVPLTINATGSFFLTKNLHFAEPTGDAITVAASDVTIDLNGFAITSDAAVTGSAIVVSGNRQNITVRDGSIRGSSALPTLTGFANGIVATTAKNATFERLLIANCRVDGLNAGSASLISHCAANANGGYGLKGGEVLDCVVEGNGNGMIASSVLRCFATFNAGSGIEASFAVAQSVASRNGGVGINAPGGTVTACNVFRNGGTGIFADGGSVSGSVAERNNGGIRADEGSVANCVATDNISHGITANYGTITASLARDNSGIGLNAFGGSVSHSSARRNGQHGIYATTGVISFCTASANNTSATFPFTDIFPSAPDPVSRTGNFPTP